MGFALIATAKGQDGSGSAVATLDTTSSLNVAAGDLLVALVKHEGATTSLAVAKTTGGNAHTFDAGDKVTHSNTDLEGSFGYVLSATADATFTGRFTLGAARTFVSLIIHQFRPDAGETVSKDTSNTGQGNGTTPTSGNVTTTGTDEAGLGGYCEYVGNASSAHQINGVNADGVTTTNPTANFTAAWYRLLTATFAGGHANCTNSTGDWICNVIAFKSVAAAGGVTYPELERGIRGLERGVAMGSY